MEMYSNLVHKQILVLQFNMSKMLLMWRLYFTDQILIKSMYFLKIFVKFYYYYYFFWYYMVLFEYIFSLALLTLSYNQTEERYDWKNH